MPTDTGGGGGIKYVNPIGKGLVQGRTDMGVDFTGSGDLYAVSDGVITNVTNSGWPGGTFIGLKMDDGRYVYYAENITPAVKVGQRVKAGQKVGHANGSYPYIEVGWAAPPGTGETLAVAHNQQSHSGDPGAKPTGYGIDFANFLKTLQSGNQPTGPSGQQTTGTTNVAGDVQSIGGIISTAGTIFHDAALALNWFFYLFKPGQGWRIAMGAAGVVSGYGAFKAYTAPTRENSSEFPLAILLTSIAILAMYMALRPWPLDAHDKPIRVAPYAVDILSGQTPVAQPPPDDTGAIQAGLVTFASIWAVSKAAGAASSLIGSIGGIVAGIAAIFAV